MHGRIKGPNAVCVSTARALIQTLNKFGPARARPVHPIGTVPKATLSTLNLAGLRGGLASFAFQRILVRRHLRRLYRTSRFLEQENQRRAKQADDDEHSKLVKVGQKRSLLLQHLIKHAIALSV